MQKLKAGLFAVVGATLAVLTLRTLRQRRTVPDEKEEPVDDGVRTEVRAAVDHAVTAASHARAAGGKTIEYVESEADEIRTTASGDDAEAEQPAPVRRLQRVGKGWVRR